MKMEKKKMKKKEREKERERVMKLCILRFTVALSLTLSLSLPLFDVCGQSTLLFSTFFVECALPIPLSALLLSLFVNPSSLYSPSLLRKVIF